ncbi:MAG: hypothetical protein JWP57_1934 [Spirosoma sp.]|nr:hypothetical protein [Spirosoma sp.]
MKLQLINGRFSPHDALAILTKMTHIKVSYQEEQIKASDREEDIKSREKRIKELQQNLQEARTYMAAHGQHSVSLQADIVLSVNEHKP